MKILWRYKHINVLITVMVAIFAVHPISAAGIDTDNQPADTVAQHGARLSLAEDMHDFGNIPRRGGDAAWRFEFVNDGDEPLIITRVTTTCTCLKYKYPRRPIAPGQHGHIDVSYQPHKTEPGTFHRVVKVYSNSTSGVRMLIVQGNSIDNRRRKR